MKTILVPLNLEAKFPLSSVGPDFAHAFLHDHNSFELSGDLIQILIRSQEKISLAISSHDLMDICLRH